MIDFGLPHARATALTVAGSDPSGGAGIQADLKTFHQFGVYGMAVPSVITVQSTVRVESATPLDAQLVRAQLECVQRDIPPTVAKTGVLGTEGIVREVARWISETGVPLVVDPVVASSSGHALATGGAMRALIRDLLPRCLVVTPNIAEAEMLSGIEVRTLEDMANAARRIGRLGPRWVLVKGGHLAGAPVDLLWSERQAHEFRASRIAGAGRHGTGCTYSAAIAALLSRGLSLPEAVARAKRFVTEAIRTAPKLGSGAGPVNHHARTGLD